MRFEKEELKKVILAEANFFIRNKIIYFVYKEIQLLRNEVVEVPQSFQIFDFTVSFT